MALEFKQKRGGPYSKNDQQRRQAEVYRLHFDHGYSAVKIADMMKINRNTINLDIKQLYERMSKEFSEFDAGMWIVKQLNRLESQRIRLLENLESQIEMHDKTIIEKLVFDIDQKIIQFSSKMMSNDNLTKIEECEISEEKIKDITRHMIKDLGLEASKIIKNETLFRIIEKEKCDVRKANQIYDKMLNLGLELCMKYDRAVVAADFLQFARLRNYISMNNKDEVFQVINEQTKMRIIEEQKEAEFKEKHGPKETWSEEIWAEFIEADETSTN